MDRRTVRAFVAFVFASQFFALTAVLGGAGEVLGLKSVIGAGAGIAFWFGFARLIRSRPARAAAALGVGVLVVANVVYVRFYRAFLDAQALLAAADHWADIRSSVRHSLPEFGILVILASLAEYILMTGARVTDGARRRDLAWTVGAFVVAVAASRTMDFRTLRALPPALAFVTHRGAQAAQPAALSPSTGVGPVGPIAATRPLPWVLVILTESVRADEYCSAPGPDCRVAPRLNAALPSRVPLENLRSVASYTAVAVGSLLSGALQTGQKDELASQSNLFDFVKNAHFSGRTAFVGYWSAHSKTMFERTNIAESTDVFVTLETVLGREIDEDPIDTGFDARVVERFENDVATVDRGGLFVLHVGGTHAPYYVDDTHAAFRPFTHTVTWSNLEGLRNAYRNSILTQDALLERALVAFRRAAKDAPQLVLFTSDHGESFGENGAIHHGQNLFEEQIRVPGFVDESHGALTAQERKNVERARREPTTHLDIVPTLLDVFGIAGVIERKKSGSFLGRSWLRGSFDHGPIVITNCTPMFRCPVNTWGVLGDRAKLSARVWDPDWLCTELGPLDVKVPDVDPRCVDLRRAARLVFPTLPNGQPNGG
jgi:glucan phosphoethanolaminetransferase (alkaline phosphatase superfamily)